MKKEAVIFEIRELFEFHMFMDDMDKQALSNLKVFRDELVNSLDDRDAFMKSLLECVGYLSSIGDEYLTHDLFVLKDLLEIHWFKEAGY